MKKIFILAGEPSGDLHGARLMKSILSREPSTTFIGIGGDKMIQMGLKSLIPMHKMSVVGMWEVAKKLQFFSSVLKLCKDSIIAEKPDVFVPVDYPGFNIRLSAFVKKQKIPVIYYIAPQLWAWGKNRASKITGAVDILLTVLPFEEEFFRKFGIDARYVGHPLLDDDFYKQDYLPFEEREKIIALFPGSRKQEIIKHKQLIIGISDEIKKIIPDYRLVIAKSSNISDSFFTELTDYAEISTDSKKLMRISGAGIVKTGTTNLEAVLSGLPGNMFYKTSWLSYNLGKQLININYLSLANILLNKPVIREFIQDDAKPDNIVKDIADILNNPLRYQTILDDYQKIRNMLGEGGASQKAGNIILDYING